MKQLTLKEKNEIRKIILDLHLTCEVQVIEDNHRLSEDLGFDDIDILEMFVFIEDRLGVNMYELKTNPITVEDVFLVVESRL